MVDGDEQPSVRKQNAPTTRHLGKLSFNPGIPKV
jgi:hypothetical protein